ncbi:glycoside hydrolase domain-containing protein [Streptomyces alkaliterrae]|nr:glycoside hydrolase domain-containing protein [Streptomyces alkaliterrae]
MFLHYRGGGLFAGELNDEEDCRKDVAKVFHKSLDGDYGGDMMYNFLVCPHGHVYQGRGYERAEANAPGYVDLSRSESVGRNTGFYSICGLLRGSEMPTEEMLRSIRSLIAHLRDNAPSGRRAGTFIFPHSHDYDTDCPGNLLPYARTGSSVDPAVDWNGSLRIDPNVLAAQQWVNRTYEGVAGYTRCEENGRTGWDTVLALTQGLQHELGISPTVRNFGPGTFAAVRERHTTPANERNGNIVRLYNWALWCKGYWASTEESAHIWLPRSQSSLEQLQRDMGLGESTVSAYIWAHMTKALFQMQQFKTVPGGDLSIRAIQQRLNSRYLRRIPAMEMVPCDGIYSRGVQKGLMMSVQFELDLAPASITGYFGPSTQAGLRGKGSGKLLGDFRYLFRAACYLNSPTYNGDSAVRYNVSDLHTDAETTSHTGWLRAFQRFSQIPQTGTNDYTTWAQLLVSSGDTSRPATACDCITEITAARGRALKDAGYEIVGRYLDEHLPPESPYYLDKALKPGELQNIFAAGLRMYPIFQYNGTQLANFDYGRGFDQGGIAHDKSVEFGLPAGTCIYFAVDYDAQDWEIDSNILPYFNGVRQALSQKGGRYTFGVYGSRNVCTRVSAEAQARWSFVSGMSWGFSGNLGFPLPKNWSFNQIREYTFQPGWGLDHNIWREDSDPGVSRVVS